jgi:hypothetical protein
MLQMAIKMPFFHFKAFQNIPKVGFFGMQMYHLATLNGIAGRMSVGT